MSWVHRTETPAHICEPPRRDVRVRIPTGPEMAPTGSTLARLPGVWNVDGDPGDLWRCDDCGRLWRVADACDACDAYGHRPHGGLCTVGLAWRPATFWQRIKFRRAR